MDLDMELHSKFFVRNVWEFLGGIVVIILGFHCHGLGSNPGWGTQILQA